MNLRQKIEAVLVPVINTLGYELWGFILSPSGSKTLLRIYIDKSEVAKRDGAGITLDDCSNVSRQLSALLDVENLIVGSYTLEVSSPGLDRPLFTLAQYQRYEGEPINVKLLRAVNGQRNFRGTIKSVTDDRLELLTEDGSVVLDLVNIGRANLTVLG